MSAWRNAAGWVVAGLVVCAPGGASAEMIFPQSSAWVIESADYRGEVIERIARMEATYTIKVIRDGWLEMPLGLSNVTITAVDVRKKVGEATLMPRGSSYVLVASKKGTYQVHVKYAVLLAQDSQFEGVRFGMPQATFSTLTLFVPRKDVELRDQDRLYVDREPDGARDGVKLTARLGAAQGVDLQWKVRPADPVKIEPVVYGEVHTLVTLEEQLARLMAVVDYRIAQGEVKQLVLDLPTTLNLLQVRGSAIEDWKVVEAGATKRLTVTLSRPLKDTGYRLILEAEQMVDQGITEYAIPALQLDGVKQERGDIAIARIGSLEVAAQTQEGATRIDVRELSALLREGAASPAILAFRYHQHPYRIVLAVTRHDDHPVLSAIAEQGDLVTVLTRQGEMLTRAVYLVKGNKRQFLGVTLPEGAVLWSCLVDGKPVKPVKGDGAGLQVPLEATDDASRAVEVEIVYFQHGQTLTGIRRLHLEGPVLDVPTTIANWSLLAPKSIKFFRFTGNLDRGAAAYAFVDEPFVQLAAASPAEASSLADRVSMVGQAVAKLSISGGREKSQEKPASRAAYYQYQADTVAANGAMETDQMRTDGPDGGWPQTEPKDEEEYGTVLRQLGRLQESGILPLKILLPRTGDVYRFNRLMTGGEALELDATCVHLPAPWLPWALAGLMILPVGGVVAVRVRKA